MRAWRVICRLSGRFPKPTYRHQRRLRQRQPGFEFGVPIVAAGTMVDRGDVSVRVAWSGVGINLATNAPTSEALRAAVRAVLDEPKYRSRARSMAKDFESIDTRSEISGSLSKSHVFRLIRALRFTRSDTEGVARRLGLRPRRPQRPNSSAKATSRRPRRPPPSAERIDYTSSWGQPRDAIRPVSRRTLLPAPANVERSIARAQTITFAPTHRSSGRHLCHLFSPRARGGPIVEDFQ